MKNLFSTLKLFIFFLQLSFFSQAQTPFLRRYTVDDGLPSSHVYRVFQDSEGFIWVCTDSGLSRFDGYKFENFTTKNGLPYNDIWDIAEDKHKRLWLSSYAHSLVYYDLKKQRFEVFKMPNFSDVSNGKIMAFIEINQNKMAIIGSLYLKIIYYYPKEKKVEISDDTLISTYVRTLKTDEKMVQFGVQIMTDNNNYIIKEKQFLPTKKVSNKYPSKSALFINEKETIYYNEREIHLINHTNDIRYEIEQYENNKIIRVDKVGNDKFIVFTNYETFIIDKSLQRIRNFDFLSTIKINSAFFDNAENLWVCTKNNGLLLLTKEAQNSFVLSDINNYAIKSMAIDNNKQLWLGTDTGEIFISKNGKTKKLNLKTGFTSPIRKIESAQKNKILIVWESGQFGIFPTSITSINHPFSVYENDLFSIFRDKKNNFATDTLKNDALLGNIFTGLAIKDAFADEKEVFLTSSSGIYSLTEKKNNFKITKIQNIIRTLSIATDSKNGIFIGSSNGLFLKKGNTGLENISIKNNIPPRIINDLTPGFQETIWIATDGSGVYYHKNDKIYPIKDLENKIVKSLFYEKSKKRIWAASNEGVYAISENEKKEFIVNKISLSQGLPTLEVHSIYAENDKLYAGTNNSLAVIDLKTFFEKENKKNEKIPLIIKSIKINGKDTTRLDNFELDYTQNTIDIDFVALSYKSDKNIRYEYKLLSENSENLWQEINDTKKSFAFLAPGNYQFFLRAFDIEGKETDLAKPILFKINPPFWRTWWFWMILCLAGLCTIGLSMFLYRKSSDKELETTKKFAELELQALQSQMNPHFVFNALSSIQSFILNQNTQAANEYLTNFSKLIRLFLESSRNRYIAISDEKVLIEKYIQLEQARFRDKFTFEIKDLNFIEPTYEIPSMLIQPFVENAINHGLVYKENFGYLSVSFEEKKDELICIVEDDGIGRVKAKELRTKSLKAYKSRATEIIDERLKTLKLVDGTEVKIEITDKNNNENTDTGTIVKIKILMK